MSANLQDLHERAERGAADERFMPVTVTMAVLAVLAAVASLMGGRLHAEAMLDQTREADQWAQYQAKVIRERTYEVFLDQISIFAQASASGALVEVLERRSDWFDFGDVLLEAAVVICSITLLTRNRLYWYIGLLSGVSGFLISLGGAFIR